MLTDLRTRDGFKCLVTIDDCKCNININNDLIVCTLGQLSTISKEIQIRLTHDRILRKKEELKCQNFTNDNKA